MRKKNTQESLRIRLGRRLRELRKEHGHTQLELAEAAGLSDKYIGELENGHRDVRLDTLERVAAALNVEPRDLFRFTPEDKTVLEIQGMLEGRDEAFRGHLVRLVREALLLVETAR